MKTDSSMVDRRGIPWTVAGVVFLVLVVFLMWQFRRETDPTRELAFKASRVDIVGRMELALASASTSMPSRSADASHSPRDSLSGLPHSCVMITARPSARSRIRSVAFFRITARS